MSKRKPNPTCEAVAVFLRHRLGRGALAPCTGQDRRALDAWFHLVELWGAADSRGQQAALYALAHVLDGMQRSVWPIAKAGIPAVLDWHDEEVLWSRVHGLRTPVVLRAVPEDRP